MVDSCPTEGSTGKQLVNPVIFTEPTHRAAWAQPRRGTMDVDMSAGHEPPRPSSSSQLLQQQQLSAQALSESLSKADPPAPSNASSTSAGQTSFRRFVFSLSSPLVPMFELALRVQCFLGCVEPLPKIATCSRVAVS